MVLKVLFNFIFSILDNDSKAINCPESLCKRPCFVLNFNKALNEYEQDKYNSLLLGSSSANFSKRSAVLLIPFTECDKIKTRAASVNGIKARLLISKLSLLAPSCSTRNCLKN